MSKWVCKIVEGFLQLKISIYAISKLCLRFKIFLKFKICKLWNGEKFAYYLLFFFRVRANLTKQEESI